MTDTNTSNAEIVRGNGHAPGQSLGEAMPSVQNPNERASLDDFQRVMREKNEAADRAAQQRAQAARQPQTARGRVGEFSRRLEASQEAAATPGEPRQKAGEQPAEEQQGEPNQFKPAPEGQPGEEQEAQGEGAQEGQEQELPKLADQEALAKYREWDDSDLFPEELEDKWLTEVKPNGVVKYVTQKELKQGYIRGADWARMGEANKQMEGRLQAYEAERTKHFESIRDPNTMLEVYERNGYTDTLEKVAELIQERKKSDMGMIRAAGLAEAARLGITDLRQAESHRDVIAAMERTAANIKRMRQVEINERRNQFDRQNIDRQQQEAQRMQRVSQMHQTFDNQLNQLRPAAFRAYGIKNDKGNVQAFNRHIGRLIQINGFSGNITRELVMEAAKNFREELDDERRAEQSLSANSNGVMSPKEQRARQQAAARAQALPPNRRGSGAGNALGSQEGQKRGSLRDLEAFVRSQRLQHG